MAKHEYSPINLAWERITRSPRLPGGRYSDEVVVEWEWLWQEHIEGDALLRTGIHDVSILCHLGSDLAWQREDPAAVLACLRRYFEHPEWRADNHGIILVLMDNRARSEFHLGDIDATLLTYREMLAYHRPHQALARLLVTRSFAGVCESYPAADIAPAEVVALAADVLALWPRLAKGIRQEAVDGATFGTLATALGRAAPLPSTPHGAV